MSRKQSVFAPQINSLALDTVLVCLKKKQDKKLSDNFVHITVGVICFLGAANLYTFLYKEPSKMFFGK